MLMSRLKNADITTQVLEKTRKAQKLIFWPVFQAHFTLGLYILIFFRFLGQREVGEHLSDSCHSRLS